MKKEIPIAFNHERNQWEMYHHSWLGNDLIENARISAYKRMSSRHIPANADVERKKQFKQKIEMLSKPGSLKLIIQSLGGGVDLFKSTQGTGKIISLG